jgi:hypothetical protein
MERGGELELVGDPSGDRPGCGERPDLVLGFYYPNHQVFLLTPEGKRFPNITA